MSLETGPEYSDLCEPHGLPVSSCAACTRAARKDRKERIRRRKERGQAFEQVGAYTRAIQAQRENWKKIVLSLDDGYCAYCRCLKPVPYNMRKATHGDHIREQGQNRKLVLKVWNGIATCSWHNKRASSAGGRLLRRIVEEVNATTWRQTFWDLESNAGAWTRLVRVTGVQWWATDWERTKIPQAA